MRKLYEKAGRKTIFSPSRRDSGNNEGTIEAPIGRFADLKLWGVREDGKMSESKYRVRERFVDSTLLELEPVTGRTNQLRIHCELIGHPIVGDVQRGRQGI